MVNATPFITSDIDVVGIYEFWDEDTLTLKEGKTWPTYTPANFVFPERPIKKTDIISNGFVLDLYKLETFFTGGLRFEVKTNMCRDKGDRCLITVTDHYPYVRDLVEDPVKIHADNVATFPTRYGLSPTLPYLMRVAGAGFVETPTVQVGQLMDTLSDYWRCGSQPAIGIKKKYARRLARLKTSWDVHKQLVRQRYTELNNPFVLSGPVARKLEKFMLNDFEKFISATAEESECRRSVVTGSRKTTLEVKMMDTIDCKEKDARMNCSAMPAPFFDNTYNTKRSYANHLL